MAQLRMDHWVPSKLAHDMLIKIAPQGDFALFVRVLRQEHGEDVGRRAAPLLQGGLEHVYEVELGGLRETWEGQPQHPVEFKRLERVFRHGGCRDHPQRLGGAGPRPSLARGAAGAEADELLDEDAHDLTCTKVDRELVPRIPLLNNFAVVVDVACAGGLASAVPLVGPAGAGVAVTAGEDQVPTPCVKDDPEGHRWRADIEVSPVGALVLHLRAGLAQERHLLPREVHSQHILACRLLLPSSARLLCRGCGQRHCRLQFDLLLCCRCGWCGLGLSCKVCRFCIFQLCRCKFMVFRWQRFWKSRHFSDLHMTDRLE
mmetsp:Transcript_84494/g.247838  ORF Transcript_84494/g.247838 Transcript_84494/m.247838 type:complete len:316 (-) Transcript_84494:529-1476(-)